MLSFGIRFGQGFDRTSLFKVMQSVPTECDYDFLVLGSNPGGIAAAREASLAGKKTAIVKWKKYTPAEEEGYDEDLEEMASALDVVTQKSSLSAQYSFIENSLEAVLTRAQSKIRKKPKSSLLKSLTSISQVLPSSKTRKESEKSARRPRKVRSSRIDLNNELFKRGQQGRKIMRNAVILCHAVEDARTYGWRIYNNYQQLTLNWTKMMEQVMDFVMKENWKLMSSLGEESVEVIEGCPSFVNNHTVKIYKADSGEMEITADIICTAPTADCDFPIDVEGAKEFGITCNDFIRMNEPPGKTLVVGSTPEGMEIAGILACCRYPVTVVSRSRILKGYDFEMAEMIVEDLKGRGVVFMESTTLTALKLSPTGAVLAKLTCPINEDPSETEIENKNENANEPENKKGNVSAIENKKGSESAIQNKKGSASAIQNKKGSASAIQNKKGSASAIQNKKGSASAIENKKGSASEIEIKKENEIEEEFETVIFAVGTSVSLDFLNLKAAGIEPDPVTQKITTNEFEATMVPNIYAVGEVVAYRPQNYEISELAGTLLGRRLFHNKTEVMDYTMFPSVMFTPMEYAFVGLSEDTAMYRFGEDCIDIYQGQFTPMEFEMLPKKGKCFAKVVVFKSKDWIVGLHLLGPDAGEIIQGFAAAIKAGLKMTQMHSVVGVHSTKAQEILKLREPKKRQSEPKLEVVFPVN